MTENTNALATIPTVAWEDENGDTHTAPRSRELREAYEAVERAMFTDPDNRARHAEILQHSRSQQRDDTYGGDQERMNGKRVMVMAPEYVEMLSNEDHTFGDRDRKRREKTAREQCGRCGGPRCLGWC